MQYVRSRIYGTTPRDLKNLNDNIESLWFKVFGNLTFTDFEEKDKKRITAMEYKIGDSLARIAVAENEIELRVTNGEFQSYILQTDKKIEQTVVDVTAGYMSQVTQLSNLISTKVSSGDVSSIIRQSATDIQIGFNNISPNVIINSAGITLINSSFMGGQIDIDNTDGKLLIGKTGRLSMRSADIVGCRLYATIDFSNASTVSGLEKFGYATQSWVLNNFSTSNHYHSQFDNINNEFTNVGNALNNIYVRLAYLEGKVK